jgi:tetratricopeptide (TPR) repeat protein
LRQSSLQLANKDSAGFDRSNQKAREALTVASKLQSNSGKTNLLLGCLLHEGGHTGLAEVRYMSVVQEQLQGNGKPAVEIAGFDSSFDGYESDKLCPVDPTTYAVLACHFSRIGDKLRARKALRLANASYIESNIEPPVNTHGSPRRTMVLFMARAGLWLSKHGFAALAKEALTLAMSCDEAASAKANARGFLSETPAFIRHLCKRLSADVALICVDDDAQPIGDAIGSGNESVLSADCAEDRIYGQLCLSKATRCASDLVASLDAGLNAMQEVSKNAPLLAPLIPVASYLSICKDLIDNGRFQEALAVSLTGSTVHTSSALLLQTGIASLRLGNIAEAEKALQEANLLDNRNGLVWAYQTLLFIQAGPRRSEESLASLTQALRLGVESSVVLRELATAFMSVDKLQTAEDLIRRSIINEGGNGSFITRKLLGDVLSGQNMAAQAVEEYQQVLQAEESPNEVKLDAAEKCVSLLKALGRNEELKSAQEVVQKLKSA